MKFTRIRLANWRNFTQVDAVLQQRMFLVGPNASGKSNFLDVFRFLRDLVRVGGGLEKAVADRGGVSRLRSLAARSHPEIVIDVELSGPDDIAWRYRVGITQDSNARSLLKEEKVWKNGELILERPDNRDEEDKVLLRQTHLEQTSSNRNFRYIAEFFNNISYYHIVPQIIRDPDWSAGKKSDPYGGDLLERIASSAKETQESPLEYIQKALQVAVPQLQEIESFKDARGVPHLRAKYNSWRSKGAWQTEADFSDGTLRLIGLLWAVMDGNGPLLLEEPELSLHAEVTSHIPAMMISVQRAQRRQLRQILVSTHSSDLLRDPGIAPDEILLLTPTTNGTRVEVGKDIQEVKSQVDAGLSIAEAVLPRTRPKDANQLDLFEI